MQLTVRAGKTDQHVFTDLFANSLLGPFSPGSQSVESISLDLRTASSRPEFSRIARHGGLSFIVDPVTPFLQWERSDESVWSGHPLWVPDQLKVSDFNEYLADTLIERTLMAELEAGATHLVPPYFVSKVPGDGWMKVNTLILRRAQRIADELDTNLPFFPIVAGAPLSFVGKSSSYREVDQLVRAARDLDAASIGLSMTWNKESRSSEASLLSAMRVARHVSLDIETVAWGGGLHAPLYNAMGARGYETGLGKFEYRDYGRLALEKRRPGGGAVKSVYIEQLGRSIPSSAAKLLFSDRRLSGRLVCSHENYCCPDGSISMISQNREHAMNARNREALRAASLPPIEGWRIHAAQKWAESAEHLAKSINESLEGTGHPFRSPAASFAAMTRLLRNFENAAKEELA